MHFTNTWKTVFVITAAILEVFGDQKVRYDNYMVYKLFPMNDRHMETLRSLHDSEEHNFWTEIKTVGVPVDIMVPPHLLENFESMISSLAFPSKVMIRDVQEKIEMSTRKRRSIPEKMDWQDYHNGEEINAFLKELSETYPEQVKLLNVGKTYQNRDIVGVHVSFSKENRIGKRSVFVEGGIHAREWISPATVTFILNELVTSSNITIQSIARSFDWYFFPIFNPDGYAYTFAKERLWRKTMKPHGCLRRVGVDANRNWDMFWMEAGSSNNPCASNYAGPSPFSENCTRVLSDFISTIGDSLIGYIAFHSYSQFLLIPYGHTKERLDNYDELLYIGNKAASSLAARYGTKYKVGNIVELLYAATGSSVDWVKNKFKTRITYSYELRDDGEHGFLLPPENIIPTALETLDSFITMFQEVLKLEN